MNNNFFDRVEKKTNVKKEDILSLARSIQNKDLKDKSNRKNKSGIDNLHTLYFKTLMSEHQHTFDIGAGMVFFREKNYRGKKIIHQRNKPIQNKTPNYPKLESLFEYDIVKDKRYFENKFFLHLSMMIRYMNL